MKTVILLLTAGLIAGCGPRPKDSTTGTATAAEVLGPDRFGVVCYVDIGANNRTMSCVKVQEGAPR